MIIYNFTEEDIKYVEKAIELRNKGYYIDGTELTKVYNKVLRAYVNPTNCGSCIRKRINDLEEALNHYKREKANEVVSSPSESVEEKEPIVMKEEENKELIDAEKRKERMAKVRSYRKMKR